MIQDRLKIKKLRSGDLAPDVMLGRQTLLNCAAFKGYGQGCDGGEPLEVHIHITQPGWQGPSCDSWLGRAADAPAGILTFKLGVPCHGVVAGQPKVSQQAGQHESVGI